MENKNTIFMLVGILLTCGIVYVIWMRNQRHDELTFSQTFEQAGRPGQLESTDQEMDQLENAKMVSEGSQFGVQYYNKTAKEEREALEKNM